MIFNYDKQNKEIEFNGTLNDILKSTVDFFTKKQDIVKKYNPTEKDKAYFEELKKLLTDDDSDKAKQLLKTFAEDSGNDALVEYSQNVEIGKQSLADFSESQKQVTQGTTKFRAALSSVGNVIKSVGASMLNMGIAMVASWAIGKVIEGLIDLARYDENIIKAGQEAKESIDNTFKSFEEEKQKVTDLATTFADSTDQIKTAGDAIDQVAEKYTELHNGVIGSTNENRSLSDEDYQSYLNICNQLADQFPQLVSGYDAQGNAMLNLGSNADSAADSIRNLYNAQMLSAHVEMGDNLQDTYKGAVKQVEQYNDQIENLKTENENLQSEMDMYTGTIDGKDIFSVGTKRLNIDNRKMTGDQVALINKVLHNLFGDEYSLQGLSDGTTVVDGLEDLSSTQIDGLNKAYAAAVKSFYGDEIKDLQVQINTNKQKSSSIDLLIKDQWNSMTDSLSKYLQTTESFGNLDNSIQNAFLGHLTDIDLTSLSKDYDGMVLPFLYSEFIEPMNSLEPEAQESLVNLLTLDTSELNQKEYYDKVHSVIENLFPDDKDIQNQWLKALGLSSTITTASTEMGKIKTAFKNIVSEDLINDLSIDDISIGVQVLKNGFNTDDDWDKFLDAIKNYKSVTTDLGDGPTLAAVLADEDNEVSSSIDSLQSDISSLSDTLSKLKTGEFTDTDLTDLIQQFPQLADQADNLQEAIVSLQADKLKSTINKIDDAMSGASADEKAKAKTLNDSLIKSADLSGITSKEINDLFRSIYNIGGEGVSDMASREGAIAAGKFKETFASVMQTEDGREALYKALLDPDIVKSGFDGIMAAVQSNLSDIFTRRINASNDLLSKISSVQSVLTSQTTGFSIDYDDFSSDSLKDYQSALEYVNGSMQLNTQRVRELTKAKVDEQIATNNSAKAQKQQEYLQNAKQIEALRQKLLDNTDATGKSAESIQSQIDGLLASNAAIVEQCGQIDVLNSSLMESIGLYQQWKDAQNAGEAGDMFDDALTAVKQIDDTLNNTDSELYGRTGREDYKVSVDFLIPDTVDKEDQSAINSYLDSIGNFFTYNDSGERAGLNIEEFCKQAMDKGLMVLDEAGENYQVAGGKTMEDFAEGMNLAMPMVQAAFGEMSEFGANWDWSDEGIKTMGDMAVAANEAAEALRNVKGNEDLKINLDVSDLQTTEEKCSALDQTISEMNQIKATPGVDSSEIDQANTVIQYCIAQKQELESPAVMNVDVSQVSGKIGEAIALLQEFQTAQNNLEMQKALGMDTSEAQAEVDAVADKIKGLDTNVKATLSIDDTSIDTIKDSIDSKLTNEVMVKAGIDDTAIIGFQKEEHDAKGKVKWDNDTKKVDAYAAAEKTSTGKVAWYNDISLVKTQFQAVGRVNWTNTSAPKNGANSVSGTAHVSGTAMATGTNKTSGDWGNKRPGKTLVGELGPEMVVDSRSGRWYLVGTAGAEYRDIPRGAIVFNHLQTEELLSKGFTASRAVALASGTHPDLSGEAMVTGGISVSQAHKSTVSGGVTTKKPSTSSTSSTKANTVATNKNTTATDDNTEKIKKSSKAWDWVERDLTYWSNKVKAISDKITDYVSAATKTSLLKKQMDSMYTQIQANTNGHVAYMQKANAVAQSYSYYNSDGDEIKISIPEIYQQLVQRGEYNIEDMDTSTDQNKALAEAIEQYKTWYDKAQDCQQAVVDLRNEQQELFEQWANMPTEKAEKKIEGLTAGYNGLTAVSSRVTAAQSGGSTQAALAKTMKDDLAKVKAARDADRKVLTDAQNANKKAVAAKTKADKTVKSTTSAMKKTKLTATEKAQVNAGQKIDTSNLTGSKKKKAVAYNKALDAQAKAAKKVTSTKASVTAAKKPYADSNAIYQSMNTNVKNALKNYNSKDELSYMNSIVDQEVALKKQEKNARKTAVEEANKNLIAINKQKANSDKRLAEVQKYYGNDFRLTEDQKKVMKSGKEISLDGVTDIDQIRIINEYNNALANTVKEKQDVTTATNALKTAEENLASAEIETAQATVDAVKTKFDNVKNYYDARLNYQKQITEINSKDSDLSQAHGDFEKSSDYTKKIKYTQREQAIADEQAKKLKEQLDAGVKSGTIKRGSDEWYDLATQLREAQNAAYDYNTQIEQLKQQQIGVYYAEQFERAAEKVDKFRDKLDGLKALISDDMKVDKNTGLLTESGALALTLDVDDIQASTENLKTYIKERQQIINDYKADKFGEDEYNQKLKTVDENIKNTTANINSSRSSMLDLIKTQAQAELDVLNKVIDKRKEALSAKKNYYDYDKTLKNKTKDIQILERQIAALNGSTNAEDKARRAQLQEQLSDAQDALKDTITDHAYSMQSDALDRLSTDLSEDMDEWINKISSNMEEMTNAINDAVKNAGLTTAGTINAISSILKHYGISDTEIAQSGLTDIKGYASGTDYVLKDGVYNVNENGMESVYSPKYGILTFLNQGDKVYNADLTKSLLENAGLATKNNMPDFSGMVKTMEECMYNIQNMGGNTYISNFYVDGVDDIESLYKKLDAHLDQKIQANNKKIARDIRSLR